MALIPLLPVFWHTILCRDLIVLYSGDQVYRLLNRYNIKFSDNKKLALLHSHGIYVNIMYKYRYGVDLFNQYPFAFVSDIFYIHLTRQSTRSTFDSARSRSDLILTLMDVRLRSCFSCKINSFYIMNGIISVF